MSLLWNWLNGIFRVDKYVPLNTQPIENTMDNFNFVSADQLKQIMPNMPLPRCTEIAALLNEICPHYGLNIPGRFHEFIAQVAHESNEFRSKTENMNYSAERLKQVWPNRFDTATAKLMAHKPEKIANYVYANRMGNGNGSTGDGWLYRGGGFIQITGRDMYEKYARHIKHDIKTTSELVHKTDRWALDSACWLFAIEKQLLDEADNDLFELITKRINGAYTGLKDREFYYKRAKAVL